MGISLLIATWCVVHSTFISSHSVSSSKADEYTQPAWTTTASAAPYDNADCNRLGCSTCSSGEHGRRTATPHEPSSDTSSTECPLLEFHEFHDPSAVPRVPRVPRAICGIVSFPVTHCKEWMDADVRSRTTITNLSCTKRYG